MSILNPLIKSFINSLLFMGISAPITYKLTGMFSEKLAIDGCPTPYGHLLHTVIFLILALLFNLLISNYQGDSELGFAGVVTCSLISTLLFHFVSDSEMYQLTNGINGNPITGIFLVWGFLMLVALISYRQGSKYAIAIAFACAFLSPLLFYFISNYKSSEADADRKNAPIPYCPTFTGVFIHSIIYVILLFGILNLPGIKSSQTETSEI